MAQVHAVQHVARSQSSARITPLQTRAETQTPQRHRAPLSAQVWGSGRRRQRAAAATSRHGVWALVSPPATRFLLAPGRRRRLTQREAPPRRAPPPSWPPWVPAAFGAATRGSARWRRTPLPTRVRLASRPRRPVRRQNSCAACARLRPHQRGPAWPPLVPARWLRRPLAAATSEADPAG